MSWPEDYAVRTFRPEEIAGASLSASVPGSKSITNRALLTAALAEGKSTLRGVLFSEDSRDLIRCLDGLSVPMEVCEAGREVRVTGSGGRIPVKNARVNVGSAGTAARFLAAAFGLSDGVYRMDSSEQMKRRPMEPLIAALRDVGAGIRCLEQEGHFPMEIAGNGGRPFACTVNIDQSSQFLSALLIAAGAGGNEAVITAEGTHGTGYIRMTTALMRQFGAEVSHEGRVYRIPAGTHYTGRDFAVEPDVSAACYFYAAAAVLGIAVTVPGVHSKSLQGDLRFLNILEEMGCTVTDTAEGIRVLGPAGGHLHGITADFSAFSDQSMTLAAIAPFTDSPVEITDIGHIRLQESDRLHGMAAELARLGIRCEELADSLKIWPGAPQPAQVQTYGDHRMAMSFALMGLRSPGIVITDPLCCRKTFEDYFTELDRFCGALEAEQKA